MNTDYRIQKVDVDGFPGADGVTVNREGAWLGETDWQDDKKVVMPYADEDGDFVPAPENWRDMVIEQL